MKKKHLDLQLAQNGHAGFRHPEPDLAFLPCEDAFNRLNTSSCGLSIAEAAERLLRHGPNSISVSRKSSLPLLFRENFLHTMAILLWVAGAIGFAAKMPELGIAIWLVNIINGSFSFWQEFRAERATEALKQLLPASVKTIRQGSCVLVPAVDIVPGDIIVLEEGDKIPADARVISANSLEVDQSTLTGEAHNVRKVVHQVEPLDDESRNLRVDLPNLLFAGTTVQSGHGQGVVYATGISTEFGRIAHLMQTISDQPSPLQREMTRVSKIISILALGVGALIFAIATVITHVPWAQAFIFAMGIVVAFVPEGMVPTVTLALALAVQRMSRRNALVKRLSSVEALGCTNVICTDKTGTLTENKMSVVRVLAGFQDLKPGKEGFFSTESAFTPGTEDLQELMRAAVLCNNASLKEKNGELVGAGDPTETAMLFAANKIFMSKEHEEKLHHRIHENAFDSQRKRMSVIYEMKDSGRISYVKGSPAIILSRCTRVFSDNTEQGLSDESRIALREQIDAYARDGLRVLAVARKKLKNSDDMSSEFAEDDLCFLGLLAMHDPPRAEVTESIRKCHEAGIQVVMITGDYEVTAESIARKVGILTSPQARVVTGNQINRMSDQELVELVSGEIVFARVNPEHKLRIVKAFQRCGKIVAVTGDGVNDAPALKKADIGVAMGIAGTDVAREASDMILLDDNFASIVNAVEEGRAVYENIKKFSVYVFNSNMAEAVPFMAMLLSCGLIPMPLTVMQVLSIDLGTDMLPAIGLGADRAEPGIMQRSPRLLSQPLLSRILLVRALLWYGLIESIAAMSGYFYSNWRHGWPAVPLAAYGTDAWSQATTMTLACIVLSQVGAVFCCRTQESSLFSINPFGNRLILAGVFLELVLLGLLMYVPAFQHVFNTAALGWQDLAFAFVWAPIIIGLDELRKLFIRTRKKLKSARLVLTHPAA